MRILERDKQIVSFQRYEGKQEVTKTIEGKTIKTGEYTEGYSELEEAKVFVSVPRGVAVYTPKGITTKYIRNIYSENDLGLKEADLFHIDNEKYRILNVSKSFHHAFYEVEKI